MKNHTTFRVGGPATVFVEPVISALPELVTLCRAASYSYYIIGNGSNLLVSDKGIRAVVISLSPDLAGEIHIEGDTITAEAGAMLSTLSNKALAASLSGMEFAAGIPGSLGGAIAMNAGAYGGEMKDIITSVTVHTAAGNTEKWSNSDCCFEYRNSRILKEKAIVLSAEIKLKDKDATEIKALMDDYKQRRVSKQPLEYPSAGSTFKRPEGNFAGALIEQAGLKGFSVGGAQVSEKHAGFIINKGTATASDIKNLMDQVIEKVQQTSGVTLEPEVRILGKF